ncbi:MAG: hypothetical protein ACO3UU_11185 [Minisyncoccia bacterium]
MTYNVRPTVNFDPANKDHRRWLGEFTKNRSWGNCPFRFNTKGSGNTIAQMQLKLLEYYTDKEFKK